MLLKEMLLKPDCLRLFATREFGLNLAGFALPELFFFIWLRHNPPSPILYEDYQMVKALSSKKLLP
jgi:hypothetical protein